MKKINVFALAIAFCILILAACSDGSISSENVTPILTMEEAEEKLALYLADNYGYIIGSDYLDGGNEHSVFDTDCFIFDWRNGQHMTGIEDRLVDSYAISTDGSKIFRYDRGEDAWFENEGD